MLMDWSKLDTKLDIRSAAVRYIILQEKQRPFIGCSKEDIYVWLSCILLYCIDLKRALSLNMCWYDASVRCHNHVLNWQLIDNLLIHHHWNKRCKIIIPLCWFATYSKIPPSANNGAC